MEFVGAGIAFPMRTDAIGGVALVAREREIQEAIRLILGTSPGERPMRPEFGCGVHDYVFDTIDATTVAQMEGEVRDALDHWEPRIEVVAVDFDLSGVDRGELLINIGYRMRSTNHLRNLVYPFYIIPAEDQEP
jgi:phage baseplate assembly protein W